MPQVVFVSTSNYQAPRDRVTEFLVTALMLLSAVSVAMWGAERGGILWGILLGLVTLVTFPFLFAFGTILFLAAYPLLALPGTWLSNRLGWTPGSPQTPNRIWLQRVSAVLIATPIIFLIARNAAVVIGLMAGIAAITVLMVTLLILVPVLLLTALFFYSMAHRRSAGDPEPTIHWSPPNPPHLPPPE